MVRNNELEPTGAISKRIAKNVRAMIEDKGLSQEEVGQVVGRSQSYTSLRIKGLKSWTVDELDKLAPKLGYKNAIDLMRTAGTDGTSPRHLSEAAGDPTGISKTLAITPFPAPSRYRVYTFVRTSPSRKHETGRPAWDLPWGAAQEGDALP